MGKKLHNIKCQILLMDVLDSAEVTENYNRDAIKKTISVVMEPLYDVFYPVKLIIRKN